MAGVRVDKWLWSVRVFKTRSIAADACKKGRVKINGALAKPAREVKVGDTVSVRKPPIEYQFRVIALLNSRVGAKLVPNYMENITDPEQYEVLRLQRLSNFVDRAKGLGRPTKKDRRNIDEFSENLPSALDIFDWDEDWDDNDEL